MRQTKRVISSDPVLQRIMELLKRNGRTEKDLVNYLCLAKNAFDHWKFDNSSSFMNHIDKIADYLGVSIDFLVRGHNADSFVAIEKEIIETYRMLNRNRQEMILNMLNELKILTKLEAEK